MDYDDPVPLTAVTSLPPRHAQNWMDMTQQGINEANITDWFAEHAPEASGPLTFDLIAGGHSNLTYKVTDTNGAAWCLRRPPLFQVLATAHDMEREHKIIAALHGSGQSGGATVPVPRPIGLCTDEAVNERPFYVMEFVEGTIIRTTELAQTHPVEFRQNVSRSLVEVLAQIHAVDVDAVGLGDLGKKEDYIARQLRRWMRQFDESKVSERPVFYEIHDHLVNRVPDQGVASIVHGDYRLDNCMVGDDAQINAVLDWELCTLGDRLADLSGLLCYWTEPGDERPALDDSPTSIGGFASRAELLEIYEEVSGRSLDNIDFYLSFSAWRLASILEGVYSRYVNGAMGDKADDTDTEQFVDRINGLLETAAMHAEGVA